LNHYAKLDKTELVRYHSGNICSQTDLGLALKIVESPPTCSFNFVILITLTYMGVGGSIKIRNFLVFYFMHTFTSILKKVTPLLALLVVVLGVLNFGSYDPYNELSSISPEVVEASAAATSAVTNVTTDDADASLSASAAAQASSNGAYSNTSAVSTCNVTASANSVVSGSGVDIYWETEGFASVTVNGQTMSVVNGSKTFGNITTTTTYTLVATSANGSANCTATVTVGCLPPIVAPTCQSRGYDFTAARFVWNGTAFTQTITHAEYAATVTGNNTNASWTSNKPALAVIASTNAAFREYAGGASGSISKCDIGSGCYNITTIEMCGNGSVVVPVPTCTMTPAATTITSGQTVPLVWTTTNAASASLTDFGVVANSGTVTTPALNANKTYTLTVLGVNGQTVSCQSVITVTTTSDPLPRCDAFTASPTTIVRGASAVLNWATTNATSVSIDNGVGQVAVDGTFSVAPLATTLYTLTASDAKNQRHTCTVTVTVEDIANPLPRCDAFTVAPTALPVGGGNVNLNWSTTNATGVSISPNPGAVAVDGAATVAITSTTNFVLTATNATNTTSCQVTATVETGGGGGGGSNSPRCELSVSDSKIELGDSVKLTWDSSRATSLLIEDKSAKHTVVTTDGLSSSAKDRLMDGTITVSPKKDTTYVLTVKKGSKTRTCTVKVDISDDLVIKELRDQQPLVSGISLTSVPYTGFEAGPILTLMFYVLLMSWALYMAYLLVVRRDAFGGVELASSKPTAPTNFIPETISTENVVASVATAAIASPINLPVAPVFGYANVVEEAIEPKTLKGDDSVMTDLENFAHSKNVLLSGDAIRHFVSTTEESKRTVALEQVIVAAKAQFPAEDGWIVINEKRMLDLCTDCVVSPVAVPDIEITVLPKGAGSLAEAIVTGNVVAAYEMIGNRPMFALADAASDLDAVYRIRQGGTGVASELLMKETAKFSEGQILQMIQALTGALDGTYNDEASAVKMSIMKAIKAAA
jgi:hypothetical protein